MNLEYTFRENSIALETISDFKGDTQALKRFVYSATTAYTTINIPVHGCFYIQEFAKYYDTNIVLIKSICEKYGYTDKRKNDIMKQRCVQFAVYYTYVEILEAINNAEN